MNRSIRYKLLAYMTVSVIIFALLLYGANTFFAERYYTINKKNTLIKSTKEITQMLSSVDMASDFQDENLIFELNRLEKSIGGSIFIGEVDGTLYYPVAHNPKGPPRKGFGASPFFNQNQDNAAPQGDLDGHRDRNNEAVRIEPYNQNSFFITTKDPNLRFETLRLQTNLENGLVISVWIPMTEISEGAALSNRLTAIIALITIIFICIWAFYISDKFTKPITQMSTITKRMADLDFSQTIDIESEDEIGQLAKSINHLSGRLDSTIGELNSKNRQLEIDIDRGKKIDMMRREFISNVSHELKTPIFLIQGYTEGLKTNVANDEEKRSFYCDVIMEEAEKMDVIVKDLLNLSQLEAGTLVLDKTDFDIRELIMDAVKKLEPFFNEKNIKVNCNINESIVVIGDPFRIEQVLINYLNNAINHADNERIIEISAECNNDKIRVTVYNSGEQIPKEAIDKLWTSFYKVDKARTREYGGTGLGLAIVRAIQDAHNNKCGVRNVYGGVEFWFDVDAASDQSC